jgi:GntR family transcriptional regulator
MVSRAAGRPAYMQVADALRAQITGGELSPGSKLPSEKHLMDTWDVSSRTVRVALDQLRAEGLVVSRQGSGVYVRKQDVPRRLSTDITTSFGWYHTLKRQGLQAAGETTVSEAPASALVAEWLGISEGTPVTVRDRLLGTEEHGPVMLATSQFPGWVVEQAPALADPSRGGMPEILREHFGDTYSHDVLTVRMPTPDERVRLRLDPGTPVLVIRGGTYDQEQRALHFIEVVAAGGRIEFSYLYGQVPIGDV